MGKRESGSSGLVFRRAGLLRRQSRLDLFLVPREPEVSLKLLGRHIRAGGVELGQAIETSDPREPCVLDPVWERLCLDGQLCDGVEVRVFHGCFELVVGVLFLKFLEGFNEPFWGWGLVMC